MNLAEWRARIESLEPKDGDTVQGSMLSQLLADLSERKPIR